MIDTHTHLYSEEFDRDRPEMLARAEAAGVTHFFLPAIDSATHEKMLALEAAHPTKIATMMGLHPCSVQPETWEKELDIVRKMLDERSFCAIGEIGIDLYWDKSTLALQVRAFEQQLDWAVEKDLPVVLHIRNSFPEVFEVLERKKHPNLRGIFHCFSGTPEDAQRAVNLNFILGIGGVVTFKNGGLDQFLSQIPLDKIVLETDAPYLAPVPYRGKRNEPAYLKLICAKLSQLYGLGEAEIARRTTENAWKIFGKNIFA